MRSDIVKVIVVVILVFAINSFSLAGTIRSPIHQCDAIRLELESIGAEFEFLKRDVEFDNGEIVDTETNLFLLNGAFITDSRVSFYLRLGIGSFNMSSTDLLFEELPFTVSTTPQFDENNGYAYGAGLEFSVVETYPFRFDLIAQALYYESDVETQAVGAPLNVDVSLSQVGKWLEYELAGRIAYEHSDKFLSYGGVSLCKVDGKVKADQIVGVLSGADSVDFKESELVSIFLGIDYKVSDALAINGRFQAISQTAFAISVRYLF